MTRCCANYDFLSLASFISQQYSSRDDSPLAIYIMHPFWNWLVQVRSSTADEHFGATRNSISSYFCRCFEMPVCGTAGPFIFGRCDWPESRRKKIPFSFHKKKEKVWNRILWIIYERKRRSTIILASVAPKVHDLFLEALTYRIPILSIAVLPQMDSAQWVTPQRLFTSRKLFPR